MNEKTYRTRTAMEIVQHLKRENSEVEDISVELNPEPCRTCRTLQDVSFGPDPYDEDVNNDPTPVWECGNCRAASADDI